MTFPANVNSIRVLIKGFEGIDFEIDYWKGSEGLHTCSEYIAEISTADGGVKLEDLIHKAVIINLDCHEDENQNPISNARQIIGIIRRVEHHSLGDAQETEKVERFKYKFYFVPLLWGTTQSKNTRIFQEKTSKDIIKEILGQDKVECEFNISTPLSKRIFCVQYQETDYAFVSRLAEEDGFFFYIDPKSQKVFFTDSFSNLEQTAPMKNFVWNPGEGLTNLIPEVVQNLDYAQSSVIEKVIVKNYNYMTPEEDLLKEQEVSNLKSAGMIYVNNSKHLTPKEAETAAKIALEEKTSAAKVLNLQTTCRSACVGKRFKLKDYPVETLLGDYVIQSIDHSYENKHYSNTIKCLPVATRYRPPHVTPRPSIIGVHTGIVMGPSGEKIYTDDQKLGRVKVRLNWDLSSNPPENSSCWMRLIHSAAGAGWGHHFLPRVGDEVMVIFQDGDPDLPLIVGFVHNASAMPPADLPASKFQNLIRTPFGHHMIIDDKEGKEKIQIFTKDGKNYFCLDHSSDDHKIVIISKEGKMDVDIKKDITIKTTMNKSTTVGQKYSVDVTGTASITAKGSLTLKSTGSDATLDASGKITIKAGGDVDISGDDVNIKANGSGVHIKSGGGSIDIDTAGNIKLKGPMIDIEAMGMVNIKGAMVKINC
jgi:type VI secretion system secreted protein VgrG